MIRFVQISSTCTRIKCKESEESDVASLRHLMIVVHFKRGTFETKFTRLLPLADDIAVLSVNHSNEAGEVCPGMAFASIQS